MPPCDAESGATIGDAQSNRGANRASRSGEEPLAATQLVSRPASTFFSRSAIRKIARTAVRRQQRRSGRNCASRSAEKRQNLPAAAMISSLDRRRRAVGGIPL